MATLELKIKGLLKERKLSVDFLSKKMNTTKQNVYQLIKKEKVSSHYLQQFSNILDVPVSYFFDEGGDVVQPKEAVKEVEAVQSSTLDVWRDALVQKLENQIKELQEKELKHLEIISNLSKH